MEETGTIDQPVETAAQTGPHLGSHVVTGVKWSSVSQFGRQGIQFLTTAILANLLTPADFGLVGMAMVVINFITAFKDLGTAAAVIQQKNLSDELLSSVFWINTVFGLAASVALFACGPLAAAFYAEPMVSPLLRLLSISFLLTGLSNVQQALLQRKLAFQSVAKVELAAIAVGSVVGIGSALLGVGVWSLVYQTVVMAAVTTILLWVVCPWRPRMVFQWGEIRSVSSYSLNLTGFTIINYFSRNADYMLIGKFIGAEALGYYTLAYRLMFYPLQSVSNVIGRVMFPVYAQMQDDNERFKRTYLKVIGMVTTLSFPMTLGLMALGRPLVLACFGTQWQPVVPLLTLLAPVGLLQAVGTMNGSIYAAKGRTRLQFRVGAVFTAITLLAFIVGLKWGVTGVAAAYLIISTILAYPSFAIVFKLISLPLRDLPGAIWRPLASGVLTAAVVVGLKALLPASLDVRLTLAVLVILCVVAYGAFSWLINRSQSVEIAGLAGVGS